MLCTQRGADYWRLHIDFTILVAVHIVSQGFSLGVKYYFQKNYLTSYVINTLDDNQKLTQCIQKHRKSLNATQKSSSRTQNSRF